MSFVYDKLLGGKQGMVGLLILAALILVVFPLFLDAFRLNLVGKYLTYAFAAVSLVLLWGYGGTLSLGQGIFFGLGGYAMAMFLKLEASTPENTAIQSTPGIPDFMDWNQLTALPWFWEPFNSLAFTIAAILIVPAAFAFLIGVAMFKRRVGGVYFAIITQVIAVILTVLIVGQQGYTGGINGITDLRTLNGWDITSDFAKYVFYFINAGLLLAVILLARWVLTSKFGRLLLAIRDKEDRVRFSGYDVANFKIFIFCLAAVISAIGGAMFTLQVGFMSPSFVGIVPSIEMVIFAAVGGRMSLIGAVYGTLVINFGKTAFSESFPELWLFLMGGLFIAVVMFFPNGLAGLWQDYGHYLTRYFKFKRFGAQTASAQSLGSPQSAASDLSDNNDMESSSQNHAKAADSGATEKDKMSSKGSTAGMVQRSNETGLGV
ncbi:urea ABC transporter permease subunit UrtC [Litoribrevibacter euphylliae]|uniref:Urea ABC transporter permease subunit UrtC n=1 Tax=Litoribrevibacter euphylliae TaxID=1834034 RepID=A0ABV7HF04_9GAMM